MAKLRSPAIAGKPECGARGTKFLLRDAAALLQVMCGELNVAIDSATETTNEQPVIEKLDAQFSSLYVLLHYARASMHLPNFPPTVVSGKTGKMLKRANWQRYTSTGKRIVPTTARAKG